MCQLISVVWKACRRRRSGWMDERGQHDDFMQKNLLDKRLAFGSGMNEKESIGSTCRGTTDFLTFLNWTFSSFLCCCSLCDDCFLSRPRNSSTSRVHLQALRVLHRQKMVLYTPGSSTWAEVRLPDLQFCHCTCSRAVLLAVHTAAINSTLLFFCQFNFVTFTGLEGTFVLGCFWWVCFFCFCFLFLLLLLFSFPFCAAKGQNCQRRFILREKEPH